MLNLHHKHFVNLVKENKTLRELLTASAKIKLDNEWLVIEAVPWDAEVVDCYNETTFEQYSIPFKYIKKDTTIFVGKA